MKKIDIEDLNIISSFLDNYQIETSELSFTNLFAYRNKYNFHYIILDDFLWIINIKNNTYYLSQPIGDYSDKSKVVMTIHSMMKFLNGRTFMIKKSDENFLSILRSLEFTFQYKAIRADYDYLYNFSEMQALKGNKYHKKKNHLNQFLRKYSNWRVEAIDIKNFKDVKSVCDIWFRDKVDEDLIEKVSIYDVLLHYNILDVSGCILYIEDKAVAFTIGQSLNEETLLIHFEKAIPGYSGLYPMIFNQYVKSKEGYIYVNREQDLGLEGLRKSKLSYHPIKLIEKYNVRIGDI